MSYFAHVDIDDAVDQVIVAEQTFINGGLVGVAAEWVQTSYTGSIRGKYAGIGDRFNRGLDRFEARPGTTPPDPPGRLNR